MILESDVMGAVLIMPHNVVLLCSLYLQVSSRVTYGGRPCMPQRHFCIFVGGSPDADVLQRYVHDCVPGRGTLA